jgi:phosphoenolpyruvate-protein kinase (PTS system EI component)
LGGDPLGAPILVGLGVRELSMTSTRIPRVKELLRKMTLSDAERLAEQALALSDPGAVRRLAGKFLQGLEE